MPKAMFAVSAALAASLAISAPTAQAQSGQGVFGIDAPAVTYGRYARFDLGAGFSATDSGDWLPPGASDPRVFFALDGENGIAGTAAIGFDWMNGWRAEAALTHVGKETVGGDWSRTEPATPGPHASVEADISSTALMGNVYYLPFQRPGRNAKFQPFVTAGLGLSMNSMDDWTRTNPSATDPVRSFEGASHIDLAWSVGLGASMQISATGKRPILLEASYRYYDLGAARGSATPLDGGNAPRDPLSVDRESHVLAIGLRIPLR
ncbi:outer membrane beta-barrel protein [Halovulum dunhuangense]|uniref:Outer membrane beta-barrel protein n=1 Tax=Halovulum dunhuangense TaxID=1505036 RepID=A0A849L1B6_9RHOB|nr:outer membrane beta-barrel protein [Halovulum dunhuangense]NNU80041.1 outer membrane beta-barrel protein [Halovulum dunhuangense]